MSAPELNKIHFTNPKLWSKRKKIIAAVVAIVLTLAGITTGVVVSHVQHQKECQARQVTFTEKKTQLDQAISKAHEALATVDESVKEGEGSRLAHTDGFSAADEGKAATAALNDAITKAEDAKKAEANKDGAQVKCLDKQDVTDAEAALKAVEDQTLSFTTARDAYRLKKATDEANAKMDAAKSNLAQAQKDADEQIKIVDEDSQMASDGNVKGAYDTLKNINNESHTLSTTVTTSSYDEAVASIAKAKDVDQKANDIKKDLESLKGAVNTYQEAKAAEAAAASRPTQQSASSNGGSAHSYGSTSGSQARSYSNGGGGSTSAGGSSNSGSGSSSNSGYRSESQQDGFDFDKWTREHSIGKDQLKPGMKCFVVGNGRYMCS